MISSLFAFCSPDLLFIHFAHRVQFLWLYQGKLTAEVTQLILEYLFMVGPVPRRVMLWSSAKCLLCELLLSLHPFRLRPGNQIFGFTHVQLQLRTVIFLLNLPRVRLVLIHSLLSASGLFVRLPMCAPFIPSSRGRC